MSTPIPKKYWDQICGSRLEIIRDKIGYTQEKASKEAGLKSAETWRNWESGKNSPQLEALKFLVKKGFSLNWILTGEGSLKIQPPTSLLVAESVPFYGNKSSPENEKLAEIRAYVEDVAQDSPRAKRLFVKQFIKCFEEDFKPWSKTGSRATKKTESEEK